MVFRAMNCILQFSYLRRLLEESPHGRTTLLRSSYNKGKEMSLAQTHTHTRKQTRVIKSNSETNKIYNGNRTMRVMFFP